MVTSYHRWGVAHVHTCVFVNMCVCMYAFHTNIRINFDLMYKFCFELNIQILIKCTLNLSLSDNLTLLTRFINAMQAFLQGGLGDSGPRSPGSGQTLPQNLRIISNFFRTAPDGSVRAFSQPIVHERFVFVCVYVCLSV